MASRTHSLKSVATWSLRERAVCSRRPGSPTSSVSRCSMLKWMSSSSVVNANVAGLDLGLDLLQPAQDRVALGLG